MTAIVNSCTNLTNTVEAVWNIGNKDGTATFADRLKDLADVLLLLEEPDIQAQISPLPSVTYCGSMDEMILITVTNSGGIARDLELNYSTQNLVLTNLDPDWSQAGNILTYLGGTPPRTISTERSLP